MVNLYLSLITEFAFLCAVFQYVNMHGSFFVFVYFSLILFSFVQMFFLSCGFALSLTLRCLCLLHALFIWSTLIWSGLPQPENIVLTLQVKSAHWTHSPTHPPCLIMHHCPESLVLHNYSLNNKLFSSFYTLQFLYHLFYLYYWSVWFIVQPYDSVPAILFHLATIKTVTPVSFEAYPDLELFSFMEEQQCWLHHELLWKWI